MELLQNILGKESLAEKRMERDRYMDAQINLLQSKLNRLERIFSVGMPLSESEETIERLDQIEKGVKTGDVKMKMFASVLKEVKANQEKLRTSVDEKVALNQLSMVSQRVKTLESIYGELSGSKTKDIFMNLVEIIKDLEGRLKGIEDLTSKNTSLLFQKELSKVKSEVDEEPGWKGKSGEEGSNPSQEGSEEGAEENQGAVSKIKSFFRRLLGQE